MAPLLELRDLSTHYVSQQGARVVKAVDSVSLSLDAGETVKVDGVQVTALGEAAPLGSFPFAQAAPSIRRALVAQERDAAFAVWARKHENQSLGSLTCQHDQPPQPATIDLTDWLPYLSLG